MVPKKKRNSLMRLKDEKKVGKLTAIFEQGAKKSGSVWTG